MGAVGWLFFPVLPGSHNHGQKSLKTAVPSLGLLIWNRILP